MGATSVVPQARICLHPAAFEKKFSQNSGSARQIGMSDCVAQAIRRGAGGFIETIARTEIVGGVFATGEIPRETTYEDTGGAFFLDSVVRPTSAPSLNSNAVSLCR